MQTQFAADTADTTAVTAGTVTATYGTDAIYEDTANQAFTVQSLALDGTATTTTYTALDANGNSIAQGGSPTFAGSGVVRGDDDRHNARVAKSARAEWGRPDQSQHHRRLDAQTTLTAVNQALSAVTNYAALIGATQDRMTAANTFNTALMTNYANGVSGMVDANMNTASTQLQALQTQEQLGIQSLSIANQNAALILKLFQ